MANNIYVAHLDVWEEISNDGILLRKGPNAITIEHSYSALWYELLGGTDLDHLESEFSIAPEYAKSCLALAHELHTAGFLRVLSHKPPPRPLAPLLGCKLQDLVDPFPAVELIQEGDFPRLSLRRGIGLVASLPNRYVKRLISSLMAELDTSFLDEQDWHLMGALMASDKWSLIAGRDEQPKLAANFRKGLVRYLLMYYQNALEDLAGLIDEGEDEIVLAGALGRAALRIGRFCQAIGEGELSFVNSCIAAACGIWKYPSDSASVYSIAAYLKAQAFRAQVERHIVNF